ncbi:Uncharacterized protein Rs2_37728 [Raphanus sativus]|uniref:Uncharacterized protein LOC108819299 n=1 Tax=Raphanus sativus TaxID=3726 RepID=A0A6J0KLB1_RAPSA|nr:uncharacterized protein LOC108819299 [Raphanus sativus]KAJ4880673.1 Uncharacterized protein Rs2_37728 [Raphanus sativus]
MQTHDEMEVCSTVTTKKLSSLAKLILLTIQKVSDASRHKLLTTLDPHLLAKHGKTLRKSLNDAVSTSHSRITCRPSDHDDVRSSFISPVPIQLDYEFSCSSTPPRRSYASATTGCHVSNGRRKPLINKRQRHAYIRYNTLPKVRHVAAAVFPDVASSTGTMDSCHVDRAAEEFIQRFHRQLRLQKWMMAQEV